MLRILELTTAVAVMAAVDSVAQISPEGGVQKIFELTAEESFQEEFVFLQLNTEPSTPGRLWPEILIEPPTKSPETIARKLRARARAPPNKT